VVYFYSPTCHGCDKANAAVAAAEKRWGGKIRVEEWDCSINKAYTSMSELVLYDEHYGSKEELILKVFVGRRCLAGPEAIANQLDRIIEQELAAGAVTYLPTDEDRRAGEAEVGVRGRFESFGVGAIALAGLLDGINPCAFTTIIFLLSMLAYLGKSRRQLAVVGIGFTAAVFATYLLLGFGLLGAIKVFSVSHGLSTALACVVAGLTFVLAAWSLVDFVRYLRTGSAKKMTLGLPKRVKAGIHKVIRVGLSTRMLAVGAVGVGVLVAVLESLCTGQVYLPTIVFVARSPGLQLHAVAYLVLYNLMFIAPLIVIFLAAFYGMKSEWLGGLLRRHLAALKLALAVLFAALGALVLATV
jgi:cytochrome c biogenesis protein CcdA